MFLPQYFGPSISNAVAYSALIVEEQTGKVLFARNADKLQNPGALAKIMTSYLLLEKSSGRLLLSSKLVLGDLKAQQWICRGKADSKHY